ncbi:DUF4136 domain-containing protein [Leptospira idonii]|uniref:DUF4136 domain-containing protein n=1 Tax=Leptospira idonii TaxID=1193500 RepID=A0A4R9LZG1_9LEPT|nr:DUF4136 domain-containing protein [Leptospira idonii]TGN19814.1 DUF4136 domain-containing protein [Leptospira idonii]
MNRFIFFLILILFLKNCTTIATRTDTKNNQAPEKGSFAFQVDPNDIKADFISKVIRYRLQKMGFKENTSSPDFYISFRYSVKGAGEWKRVVTQTSGPYGGYPYYFGYGYSSANVYSTEIYNKMFSVRFLDTKENILWHGESNEENSCSEIIVTVPELIVSVLDQYPKSFLNRKRSFFRGDDETSEIRKQFPEVDWTCN